MLEEGTFRGKSGDFFTMLAFGATLLTCAAPFVNVQFLGSSLTFMMVYVWGRKNEQVNMSFLGLFSFTAPYLPWVLLAFSTFLGSSPVVDLLGCFVGHLYFFLWSVYPKMTGREVMRTPSIVKFLFREGQRDVDISVSNNATNVVVGGGRERRQQQQNQQRENEDERGELRRAGVIFGRHYDVPTRRRVEEESDDDSEDEDANENNNNNNNNNENNNDTTTTNALRRRQQQLAAAENRQTAWYDE